MRRAMRSLSGQLILLVVAALVVAQVISLFLFADERSLAIRAALGFEAAGRAANVARLIEEAPLDLQDSILRAANSPLIRFDLLNPQIGSPKHQGYTSEEMKMVHETHMIFGDDSIQVCPTCVRVPVANCHSESMLVETERKITAPEALKLFEAAPGITVIDDLAAGAYPMPMDCSGSDAVFIGRVREDLSSENGLAFWCVSDNLRKGAATNAVQIAELLITSGAAV